MAFTQYPDNGPGLIPVGPGSGSSGFGGNGPGGSGPVVPPGAARNLSIALSSSGTNLILTLTPNQFAEENGSSTYNIYWLNPAIFSAQTIYGFLGFPVGNGLSVIQGRAYVASIPGASGTIQYTTAYLPYSSGGWMYAVVVYNGVEYRLSGTNFVPVPAYNATTTEPLEFPTSVGVQATTIDANDRLVQFGWTNPATLTTTAYIGITAYNYSNDGSYRTLSIYKLNTLPGARQGILAAGDLSTQAQGIVLEPDFSLGAHFITWYFVPYSSALVPAHLTACPTLITGALS